MSGLEGEVTGAGIRDRRGSVTGVRWIQRDDRITDRVRWI